MLPPLRQTELYFPKSKRTVWWKAQVRSQNHVLLVHLLSNCYFCSYYYVCLLPRRSFPCASLPSFWCAFGPHDQPAGDFFCGISISQISQPTAEFIFHRFPQISGEPQVVHHVFFLRCFFRSVPIFFSIASHHPSPVNRRDIKRASTRCSRVMSEVGGCWLMAKLFPDTGDKINLFLLRWLFIDPFYTEPK